MGRDFIVVTQQKHWPFHFRLVHSIFTQNKPHTHFCAEYWMVRFLLVFMPSQKKITLALNGQTLKRDFIVIRLPANLTHWPFHSTSGLSIFIPLFILPRTTHILLTLKMTISLMVFAICSLTLTASEAAPLNDGTAVSHGLYVSFSSLAVSFPVNDPISCRWGCAQPHGHRECAGTQKQHFHIGAANFWEIGPKHPESPFRCWPRPYA